MHSGFGLVWTHTVLTGRKLTGVDPASNEIVVQTAYKGEGGSINGIASVAGSIWAPEGQTNRRDGSFHAEHPLPWHHA